MNLWLVFWLIQWTILGLELSYECLCLDSTTAIIKPKKQALLQSNKLCSNPILKKHAINVSINYSLCCCKLRCGFVIKFDFNGIPSIFYCESNYVLNCMLVRETTLLSFINLAGYFEFCIAVCTARDFYSDWNTINRIIIKEIFSKI